MVDGERPRDHKSEGADPARRLVRASGAPSGRPADRGYVIKKSNSPQPERRCQVPCPRCESRPVGWETPELSCSQELAPS